MNHPLSGFSQVLNVACSNAPATFWSNLMFAIGDRENDLLRARGGCLRKYNEDRREFDSLISKHREFIQSCPCSMFQASQDFRFQFDFERSVFQVSECYIQRFTNLFGSGQLCCYDLR